jgi:CubicO group peptidase (beta-lactamase class C family)
MEDQARSGMSRREVIGSLAVLGGCASLRWFGVAHGWSRGGLEGSLSFLGAHDPVRAFVTQRMSEYGIPGMSVATIRRSRMDMIHAGYNDVEFEIPVGPETVYQIASVSKIFAGIAVMLLVDDGNLEVEAPVKDILPGIPEAWSGIRVHHLLEHTSGLPRGPEEAPGYQPEAARRRRREIFVGEDKLDLFSAEERLEFLKQVPLANEPGARYSYNQMGYMLVGMIVARYHEASYPSFLTARVFRPLGMTSARFGDSRVVVPNRRQVAYTRQYGPFQNWLWPYSTSDYPAAGLNVSVQDLAKCLRALAEGRLLSARSRERMWTRLRLTDGTSVDYGLGWSVKEMAGRTVVGHEGGGCCWLTHVPEEEVTAIALSNLAGSGADDTSDRIATLVIEGAEAAEESG